MATEKMRRRFVTLCVGALLVLAGGLSVPDAVRADDIEAFFPPQQVDPNLKPVHPNIMFIIDTSGSMTEKDGDAQTRLQRVQTAFSSIISGMNQNVNVGLMRYSSLLGGPITFPVAPIDAYVDEIDVNGAGDRTMQVRILDGVSEAQELGTGGVTLAPGTLTINGSTITTVGRHAGIRFDNVQIPQGVKLTSASILFHSDTGGGTAPTINLYVENATNSLPYTTASGNVSSRSYGSAIALTDISTTKGADFSSGDLSSQLNAIIGSPDWCGGNALGFRVTASGGDSSTGNYRAIIGSSQNSGTSDRQDGALSAVLSLSFSPADPKLVSGCNKARFGNQIATNNDDSAETADTAKSNQPACKVLYLNVTPSSPVSGCGTKNKATKVGLRFANLNIPKGATILSAEIDFTSYATDTSTPTLLIQVENAANPASYSATGANTIGNRMATSGTASASVNWPTTAWSSSSSIYTTPDLKALVQAVVNRSDWSNTSNALSFFITPAGGSGQHAAYSHDGGASSAPRLRIQIEGPAGRLTVRQYLQELANGFIAQGGTPTMGVLYEAARYFRGEEAFYGRTRSFGYAYKAGTKVNYPGSTGSAIQIDGSTDYAKTSRLSHRAAFDYSKGVPVLSNPASCDDSTPGVAACDGQAWTGTTVYKSPIADGCQSNNLILLSDGLPNVTTSSSPTTSTNTAVSSSAALIKALPGFSGSCEVPKDASGVTQTEWQCGNELTSYLFNKDQSSVFTGAQNIRTYTIAFGPSVAAGGSDAAGAEFLKNLASNGGGKSFTANSVQEVVSAFSSIVGSILDINTTFVAPAVTVNNFNQLTHRNELYFAVFQPSTEAVWPGNLKRYRLFQTSSDDGPQVYDASTPPMRAVDPATGFFREGSRSFWSASADGDSVQNGGAASVLTTTRKIYTYAGSDAPANVELTAAAQALNESNNAITAAMLGMPSGATSADRTRLLQWARGIDVLNPNNPTGARKSLGDPLHSEPLLITYGGTDANPDISIFMGDNQGYLHAFNASTGAEQFAFIPPELLTNLYSIYSGSGSYLTRTYGVDGPITASVSGASVSLYAGMRRGGSSYYALDVSDRSKPLLKFVIKGGSGGYAELGQTWSRAIPAKIRIGGMNKNVLIFSGGYDPGAEGDADSAITAGSRGRALFVADAATGELLWWAGNDALATPDIVVPEMKYAIPASPRPVDLDGDGLVDRIYLADTGGQVFRVVLEKDGSKIPSLSNARVQRIAALAGTTARTARRFYATPDIALIAKDTVKPYLSVSVGSGFHEHPLAQTNEDRFYILHDPDVDNASTSDFFVDGDADLYDATANLAGSADAVKARKAHVDIKAKKGLYITLGGGTTITGEKVMSEATTFDNQVLFATYQPGVSAGNACSAATGLSRLYQIRVSDATPTQPFSQPTPDDGLLTAEDRARALKQGGLPPNPVILFPSISSTVAADGSNKVCIGSACLPDQALICVGAECFQPGLKIKTTKTFWRHVE
ncbi:MAG: VWA domain-containing protein [Stenotrophobium sp.]